MPPSASDARPVAINTTAKTCAARLRGAVKRYGARRALDGLDLDLVGGRWTGLIGPNGAGKTTAMLALAGLIPLDGGTAEVQGRPLQGPPAEVLGWVPQRLALYDQLTAAENLGTFATLSGLRGAELRRRIDWALDWSGLADRAGEPVATFSGGMQRRLNIACAVLHRPRLLLLDEPTVGVDPQARARIFAMLEELRQDGVALLHSSHELGDVETVCDHLVIIDGGQVVAEGTIAELLRRTVGEGAVVHLELAASGAASFAEGCDHHLTQRPDGTYAANLGDVARDLPALLATLTEAGAEVRGVDLRRPGLQDVFLALTGRGLRE